MTNEEMLIKSRKSACLEKLPSEVPYTRGLAPLFSESITILALSIIDLGTNNVGLRVRRRSARPVEPVAAAIMAG